MKNKILKLTVLGMGVLGVLGVLGIAYGASKNRNLNGNEYISEYSSENRANISDNVQLISVAKAKSIALSQVPGANESHLGEVDLDREHGRMVYEIEIFYNNSKYEYDIDAVTGEIVGSKIKKYNNWN